MARFFRFVEKKRGERRTGSNWIGSLGEAIFCGSLFLLGTLLLGVGSVFVVELLQRLFSQDYRALANAARLWPPISLFGYQWSPTSSATWLLPAASIVGGAACVLLARRMLSMLQNQQERKGSEKPVITGERSAA